MLYLGDNAYQASFVMVPNSVVVICLVALLHQEQCLGHSCVLCLVKSQARQPFASRAMAALMLSNQTSREISTCCASNLFCFICACYALAIPDAVVIKRTILFSQSAKFVYRKQVKM